MAEVGVLAPRSGPGPRLWHVRPGLGFADTLAAELALAARHDPLALVHLKLIVPSRRAAATLSQALVDALDGQPRLLPRLVPVADEELPEPVSAAAVAGVGPTGGGGAPPDGWEARDLAMLEALDGEGVLDGVPVLGPVQRQLALARLLGKGRSLAQALELARGLGRALDVLAAHGLSAAALADEGDGLADHWGERARVLAQVLDLWPALLAERGLVDAVPRREAVLHALAGRWLADPPPGPVLAAGFSEAPPAVRALLRVVARMPRGGVVLPAVDGELAEADWARVAEGPAHPQRGLARLLAAMGATRADLQPLGPPAPPDRAARARAVAGAMRTAAMTAPRGRAPAPPSGAELRGFVAAHGHEEARAIALLLRRALDRPGRMACLVTPDRGLARTVSLELARLGVRVDDSAGQPLSQTLPGRLVLLLAEAVAADFAPVELVSLVMHPLVGGAEGRSEARQAARTLDLVLRGPAPGGGLAGPERRLARPLPRCRTTIAQRQQALAWWTRKASPPLVRLRAALLPKAASLDEASRALVEAAEALAGGELWYAEAGRALADLVEQLDEARALEVRPSELPAALRRLFDGVAVRRPVAAGHPRLAIRGLLEARLTRADVVVLGGLVEGQWPALGQPDPWIAPGLARRLGLPTLDDRIAAQAHDLVALASSADEVWLTASQRSATGPQPLSRFWRRLEALGGGLVIDEEPLTAAAALDGPFELAAAARPRPAPPAHVRPRRLSVSDADLALADPFALYAQRIVGLVELDPLDRPSDAALTGEIIHAALERLAHDPTLDRQALLYEALAALGGGPRLERLWAPRAAAMIDAVLDRFWAQEGWQPHLYEARGEWEERGVRLVGRADRVDRDAQGRLRIVDYKTGLVPSARSVADGLALQMPFLRLIAEEAGLGGSEAGEVAELAYLELTGSLESPARWRTVDCARARVRARWDELVAMLLSEAPLKASAVNPYARHRRGYEGFARTGEWVGRA